MKVKLMLLGLATLLLGGCHKMYFHSSGLSAPNPQPNYSEWHHIGVLGLVEFSDPVDLQNYCGASGWTQVETENSFLSGLVSGITWGLYTPRMANVVCGK